MENKDTGSVQKPITLNENIVNLPSPCIANNDIGSVQQPTILNEETSRAQPLNEEQGHDCSSHNSPRQLCILEEESAIGNSKVGTLETKTEKKWVLQENEVPSASDNGNNAKDSWFNMSKKQLRSSIASLRRSKSDCESEDEEENEPMAKKPRGRFYKKFGK